VVVWTTTATPPTASPGRVPRRNAEFGQVLHAFVVVAAGSDPTGDELKQHVKAGLERYKVPKRFTRIDRIPRNPSGKVVRSKLQAHNES